LQTLLRCAKVQKLVFMLLVPAICQKKSITLKPPPKCQLNINLKKGPFCKIKAPHNNVILAVPDRKVGVYLIWNFEIKFGFILCPRWTKIIFCEQFVDTKLFFGNIFCIKMSTNCLQKNILIILIPNILPKNNWYQVVIKLFTKNHWGTKS
jgi:hypothetical protein